MTNQFFFRLGLGVPYCVDDLEITDASKWEITLEAGAIRTFAILLNKPISIGYNRKRIKHPQ